MLHISGPSTSFLSEFESIDVPPAVAKRCALIEDLRQQANGAETMPVPLSLEHVRSWQSCDLALVDSDEDVSALLSLSDETLLQAITAADFLCDAATMALLVKALGMVVLPDADGHLHSPPSGPASQAVRDRVAEIVLGLQQETVLCMLASIRERLLPHLMLDRHYVLRLLQLLPRTLHPAVFQICCRDTDNAFSVASFGCCTSCATRMPLFIAEPDCIWGAASPVFQLLAAAAPLAGGSFGAAWDPRAGADDLHAALEQSMQTPPAAGSRAAPEQSSEGLDGEHAPANHEAHDWTLAHGTVLQLSVRLGGTESPRWCHALAQLRHLQRLDLTLPDMCGDVAPKLAAALPQLWALSSLRLSVKYDQDEVSSGSAVLLEGISACTRLQALELESVASLPAKLCCDQRPLQVSQEVCRGAQAVLQLSRLSALTCLSISWNTVTHAWAAAAATAVKRMCQLHSLSLRLRSHYIHRTDTQHAGAAEELALDLFAAPQLTALRKVTLSGLPLGPLHQGDEGFGVPHWEAPVATRNMPIARFRDRALREHGAALTRLSALCLSNNLMDGATQGAGLAALLAAMPALQSLNLSKNSLGGAAFVGLAGVLRAGGMPALRCLDVSLNESANSEIVALVDALGHAVAAGAQGVQELDVSYSQVAADQLGPLAEALRRCHGLEVLHMKRMHLHLTCAGLDTLHRALLALPRLRLVCLAGNKERFRREPRGERYFAEHPEPLARVADAVRVARAVEGQRLTAV